VGTVCTHRAARRRSQFAHRGTRGKCSLGDAEPTFSTWRFQADASPSGPLGPRPPSPSSLGFFPCSSLTRLGPAPLRQVPDFKAAQTSRPRAPPQALPAPTLAIACRRQGASGHSSRVLATPARALAATGHTFPTAMDASNRLFLVAKGPSAILRRIRVATPRPE
jgi:hypothetical protein